MYAMLQDNSRIHDAPQGLLYTFLSKASPTLSLPTLQAIKDILDKQLDGESPGLLAARSSFAQQLSLANGVLSPMGNLTLGKRKRAEASTWRDEIAQELQKSLSSKSFLQEIASLGDDEWLSMVLNNVHSKSER